MERFSKAAGVSSIISAMQNFFGDLPSRLPPGFRKVILPEVADTDELFGTVGWKKRRAIRLHQAARKRAWRAEQMSKGEYYK